MLKSETNKNEETEQEVKDKVGWKWTLPSRFLCLHNWSVSLVCLILACINLELDDLRDTITSVKHTHARSVARAANKLITD